MQRAMNHSLTVSYSWLTLTESN